MAISSLLNLTLISDLGHGLYEFSIAYRGRPVGTFAVDIGDDPAYLIGDLQDIGLSTKSAFEVAEFILNGGWV